MELAQPPGAYRRSQAYDLLNRRLAPHLLWLAERGDGLLMPEPWSESLKAEATRRGVELVSAEHSREQVARIFTPWGWTQSALAVGAKSEAQILNSIPFDIIARVNSKLWSHQLEKELGCLLPGAAIASTFAELEAAVALCCLRPSDKWVIKSPFGFAARERVLGRGPTLDQPQAVWSQRRFAANETLIFQPWLEVVREYGVVLEIAPDGTFEMLGISDLQTNGAGTGKGYMLGRPPASHRLTELESFARKVCERLFEEGYYGPVGMDALEHREGFHPILEINARYTMGFVALAVERALKPSTPTFWKSN